MAQTLEQRIERQFEIAAWRGWSNEVQAPVTRYFRKGNGKHASLFAVVDWNRRVNTSVDVMFKGLYGHYWFQWAEMSVMEAMTEMSEEEARKRAPGLVEEAKLLALGDPDSYLRLALEVLGQLARTLASGTAPQAASH